MENTEQENEISLADLWATIMRYKKLIVVMPIICGVVAFGFVNFVLAPKWEATAILQVGQVGQVGGSIKLVEPVSNVIVRMMQPSFAEKMLKQSNLKAGELAAADGIYKSTLKATKIKDADLIEIKLRGYSPEMAQTLPENTVGYLQKIHDEMMASGITRTKAQIQAVDEDLQSVKADINSLSRQLQGNHNWNSYNATLAASVLQDKANQQRSLVQTKLMLAEQLSPSITFTTKVVGDISISEGPVSPKKTLIIAIAALLGLLGAMFIALTHNAVSKKRV